jgi:glycogen debranching enzyme
MSIAREPWLLDSLVAVRAPALVVSGPDGQIEDVDASGFSTAAGYYDRDRRILSRSRLTVDGEPPACFDSRLENAGVARHRLAVRSVQGPTPDPVVVVERVHTVGRGERIVITNRDEVSRALEVRLEVAADLVDMSDVRRGEPVPSVEMRTGDDGTVNWVDLVDGNAVNLEATPRPAIEDPVGHSVTLRWSVVIDPKDAWVADITLNTQMQAEGEHPLRAANDAPWLKPDIKDPRLRAVVLQGLEDLKSLLLAPAGTPQAVFVAAGAPWYLTLFGRDSLWAARLLLPVDHECDLAYGTLLALSAFQGAKDDPAADEEAGKILHELRCRTTRHQQGEVLPPLYYGSMDATPLFVLLLVDAFNAGMAEGRVREMIPYARLALKWMRRRSEADAKLGFIRYTGHNPEALFNHGWKDSADAIVNKAGKRAVGPLALAEVQAYAINAANGFAEMLVRLDGDGALAEVEDLRIWAGEMAAQFLKHFEVCDGERPYYAIALDRDDVAVDGLTSNIGHLLGTGILDPAQSASLARALASEELFSGWGVRTRSENHTGFNELGYHGGSVWAHDTAIAIRGLARAAHEAVDSGDIKSAGVCSKAAYQLADGLLDAAWGFGNRLPELFSGGRQAPGETKPVAFPTACRPQAWSAAAGVAVYAALESLDELREVLDSS